MDNEDVPYRSGIMSAPAQTTSSQDEMDYSTLLRVQSELNRSVDEIDSIHVFDLTATELSIEAQILAYRKAREVIAPLQTMVNNIVDELKIKQRGTNG